MELFIQTEGNSIGTEVEVVKETPKEVTLRSLATGFVYGISARDFARIYKRKEDVADRDKNE